jgi:hypothetical protein
VWILPIRILLRVIPCVSSEFLTFKAFSLLICVYFGTIWYLNGENRNMAIRIEYINLIIPIKNIALCYPGGFELFRAHHQNKFGESFWHDAHLFRDGAMNAADVESLVLFWQQKGLVPYDETDGARKWRDMCIVESFCAEPAFPCEWLEVDQENNCVFLRGRPKGRIIGREEMKLFYG